MSHPPLLFSVSYSTPPPSPTKLSDTMKWLTHTPSSTPPPPSPSPTKPRNPSCTNTTAALDPTASESHISKAMRSLRQKPSMLSLYSRPSTPAPASPGLGSPRKEAARWLFRSPPSTQSVASAVSVDELGDHFARREGAIEEGEGEEGALRKRRRVEAGRVRVAGMRNWLGCSSVVSSASASASASASLSRTAEGAGPGTQKSHLRIDSGVPSPPFTLSSASAHSPRFPTARGNPSSPPPSPPGRDDPLAFSLFRLRARPFTHYSCVGCGLAHTDSMHDRGGAVWLLMDCRHLLHEGCFYRLAGEVEGGEVGSGVVKGCDSCVRLRGTLSGLGREEVEGRHRRLLQGTRGGL